MLAPLPSRDAACAVRWLLLLDAAAEPAEPGCEAADFAEVGRGALPATDSDVALNRSDVLPFEKKPMMDPVGRAGCK